MNFVSSREKGEKQKQGKKIGSKSVKNLNKDIFDHPISLPLKDSLANNVLPAMPPAADPLPLDEPPASK